MVPVHLSCCLIVLFATSACHSPQPRPVARQPRAPVSSVASHVRTGRAEPTVAVVPIESMGRRATQQRIERVTFTDSGYLEAIGRIRALTELPIITTPAARSVIEAEGLTLTLDVRAPLTIAQLLDHMVERSDNLRWAVLDDVITLRSTEESASAMPLAYYDVRALVFARTEFIAPRIDGLPIGDDGDDAPRSGGEGEEVVQTYDGDTLVETIRIGTDPKFWDATPGASIELAESGTLIVRATPRVHGMIRGLLGIDG